MNTPTHLLISAALLTRPGEKSRNWAAAAGAILPDAYLYGLYIWSKIRGIPEREVWGRIFWEPPVQFMAALSHSAPLFVVLLMIGLLLRSRQALLSIILIVFGLSGLLHIVFDFLFHHSDAYPHFWPLSDWRFYSPLSYWEPAYFGLWVSIFEVGLALGLMVILWKRFEIRVLRGCLVLLLISYIAVPLHFFHALG